MDSEDIKIQAEYSKIKKKIYPVNISILIIIFLFIFVYPIINSGNVVDQPIFTIISIVSFVALLIFLWINYFINRCPKCSTSLAYILVEKRTINYCPNCGVRLSISR